MWLILRYFKKFFVGIFGGLGMVQRAVSEYNQYNKLFFFSETEAFLCRVIFTHSLKNILPFFILIKYPN